MCLHADPVKDEVYARYCLLPHDPDFDMQEWEYDHDEHEIKWKSTTHHKCLTSTEHSTTIHLTDCPDHVANHADQHWQFTGISDDVTVHDDSHVTVHDDSHAP